MFFSAFLFSGNLIIYVNDIAHKSHRAELPHWALLNCPLRT